MSTAVNHSDYFVCVLGFAYVCVPVCVCALMPWEILIQLFSCRVCMYTSDRRLMSLCTWIALELHFSSIVCVCPFVCVCVHVCTCVYGSLEHVCACVHVCMFVLMYMCVFMCTCTSVCLYDCACMWVCMGVFCLSAGVRVCVHVCICVRVCFCACLYVCGGGGACMHALIIMSQEIVKYCMFNCRVCTYT